MVWVKGGRASVVRGEGRRLARADHVGPRGCGEESRFFSQRSGGHQRSPEINKQIWFVIEADTPEGITRQRLVPWTEGSAKALTDIDSGFPLRPAESESLGRTWRQVHQGNKACCLLGACPEPGPEQGPRCMITVISYSRGMRDSDVTLQKGPSSPRRSGDPRKGAGPLCSSGPWSWARVPRTPVHRRLFPHLHPLSSSLQVQDQGWETGLRWAKSITQGQALG